MAAAGTIGTSPPGTGKPRPFSSHQRWAPPRLRQAEGAAPGQHHGVHGLGQRGGIQCVRLMGSGPAAPDVDRAHGSRRRQDHGHPAQPAAVGLLDVPHPDPGTSVIAPCSMAPLLAPWLEVPHAN